VPFFSPKGVFILAAAALDVSTDYYFHNYYPQLVDAVKAAAPKDNFSFLLLLGFFFFMQDLKPVPVRLNAFQN
jgi:hypothetical protein